MGVAGVHPGCPGDQPTSKATDGGRATEVCVELKDGPTRRATKLPTHPPVHSPTNRSINQVTGWTDWPKSAVHVCNHPYVPQLV